MSNMFKKTKRNLILMYSSLIGCILLIMVLLFYFMLSNALLNSVDRQLALTGRALLNHWAKMSLAEKLLARKNIPFFENQGLRWLFAPNGVYRGDAYVNYPFVPLNQFYFLMSPEGKIIVHSLRSPDLLSFFQSSFSDASLDRGMLTYKGDRVIKLKKQKGPYGTLLYTGMEVTDNVRLLRQMRWALFMLAVLFLFLSVAMGTWFSGRAMIPIQRSYRRQQDFVADASHELRTPLSILRTSVEILEEEKDALSPFHQKVLADMKKELSRMTRLIEDLLTLARSDSGRLEIRREPFSLKRMAESAAEAFAMLAREAGLRLEVSIDVPESFLFDGDEERLKQLIYILLDNAVKYNRPGGEIRVEIWKSSQTVFIRVSDTGIGIPKEEIPHIFERFYRVEKGRSRARGGAGLGLSIAAWIVDAHGGQIRVDSEPGKGTAVQVELKG